MAKKPTLDEMRLALTRGKTKHEHAHEKARLNAIKMLGLHEKNTAQDRAKAMGFDLETFHGTDAPDIESLDPERTKIIKGVFSTTNPKTASRYAEDERKRANEKTAPNVLPLLIKSASHETIPKYDINTINAYKNRGAKGVYRPEMQTAVTFDPSHIRSRFAAFDPAREHDTDLLAAKGGEVLPRKQRNANLKKFLSSSKVKEKLYHATPNDFKEFQGEGFDPTISGNATWLSTDPHHQPAMHNISGGRDAQFRQGTNVMPVHVQAKVPLYLDDKNMIEYARAAYANGSSEFPDLLSPNTVKLLKEDGYDSIIHADPYKTGRAHEIIMLEPKRIKSAIGNRGTYDINESDINKAKGGNVPSKYPSIEEMLQKLQEAGRTPIMPAPDRWFKNPEKHPYQQKAIEKLLAYTGHNREAFPHGAHINPITGEPLDFEIMHDLGVAIDPVTGTPRMSGIKSGLTEIDPRFGTETKSNLIRKSLFKHEGGDPLLDRIKFLATIEKSGKGHHYGLSTQYASPAELVQEMRGNPTLRPHSRGDIYSVGDEVGRISIKGKHHPVYEKLLVAPSGMDVQGKKLHKAKGGITHAHHLDIEERPL